MSISDRLKIDAVGTDNATGNIILTIIDHIDWSNSHDHLLLLQAKINAYIEFIEGEQILEEYPASRNAKLVIEIVSKYPYNEIGIEFLEKVKSVLDGIGIGLNQKILE